MAADEHLRRSFDALAERLREVVSRELDAISGELSSSLNDEQARAHAEAAEEKERALAQAAHAHEDALDRARREAREEAEREAAERLLAARAEVREEAERAAHERLTAARTEDRDLARTEALELARAEREAADLGGGLRLLEAIRALDRARSLSETLDTLAGCAGREAARVAVLLVRGDLLRGWRFVGFGADLDGAANFEAPLAVAGVIGDAVRTGAAASTDSAVQTLPPPFGALPPGCETLALPVAVGEHVVAVLYADQGAHAAERGMSWPVALEIMTRHAARSLEAMTACRAAQIFQGRDEASATPAPASLAETEAPGTEAEESARRYARLLISEIKLYHEPEVIAGRRERNLADRLGGEITRARVLYEQRVPARVRERGDYFQEELVRTLADGDEALLAKG